MALVFGLVQLANKFQLDAPENTNILRIAYASVQLIGLATIAYIYTRIKSKKDQTKLVYSEPKAPFSTEEPALTRTTFEEYDIGQIKTLLFQTFTGIAIIGFMHFKWGYLRPLLLQSVLGLRTLSSAPLVQVWVFGKEATGDLARPWKAANPLGGGGEPATEKDIKAKERKEEKKKISSKKTD
ncbi:hypothetical protein HDV06_000618 [Boothiomyces sp. JEL0866]|nr:hypothetical protein HDV06_000618 [Boothiomyces sp. JEL0866]